MSHCPARVLRSCLLGLTASAVLVLPATAEEVNYSHEIQPILARRCFACHGPAEEEGGLALHDPTAALARLESGSLAIVPGQPEASAVMARITENDPSLRMPPEGDPLTEQEIGQIRAWISAGAEFSQHWSFVQPERPDVPVLKRPERAQSPIDAFVFSRLEAIGLDPAPRATPAKLIRRLYLDLVGMLPPAEEAAAFEAGAVSYSDIVERLLGSPHFGERWGRHWLDLARYADSFGYERDDVRPNAWRYRDWVIKSFNANQPYDQFLIEQLAGDLLDNATLDQRIAVGLHRMNIKNNESGINKEDYRNREMVDRVNTTSTAMLGLTLGCCQCHSHKYDPFSQSEYYQLYAFFNNIEPENADIEGSANERARYEAAKAILDAQREKLETQKELLAELQKHPTFADWRGDEAEKTEQLIGQLELDGPIAAALRDPTGQDSTEKGESVDHFWNSLRARADDVRKARRQLSVDERHLPKPYVMTLSERTKDRRTTHLLERGDFKRKAAEVRAATPGALPPLKPRGESPDRIDLARWIASGENPLTARVAINHIWSHLMGRGIVTTMDDFGTQGQPPTHPKLLDWLAVEFIDSGWDRKALIRKIVHSAVYQQSSQTRPTEDPQHRVALGPENPLFARQARFRVEAEIIRDIFLDASGLLHRRLGGPTVHPAIPAAVSDLGYKYKTRWHVSDKPHRYRRGLYIHFKRTNPYPTLIMFDGPESNVCQAARNRSNTPLQALATLNDPVFVECAQALGQNLARRLASDRTRIVWLGARLLARAFNQSEVDALLELLAAERDWYRQHPQGASELVGEYTAQPVDDHETAAWIAVARATLNLDEFVTRE